MKSCTKLTAVFAMALTAFAPQLFAQLDIPSDGSDGALVITSNTVIDLSQAVTGVWSNNNSANVGKGIYDPVKWAVVFKYSSVTIASNATVTFSNHPTHAPVVWLVNGNVIINGNLNLDGQNGYYDVFRVSEPGPGGYRGGASYYGAYGWAQGAGFGPSGYLNDHGSYSTYRIYGNAQVVPLIGGSGGGGNAPNGGGGGGAILIASQNDITINGLVSASGGYGAGGSFGSSSFDGSGGAVRLIADQIFGNGRIEAIRTYPGRIRLEANSTSGSLALNPPTVPAPPTPLTIWPDLTAPVVKVISVGGQSAPLDPKASLTAPATDVTITTTNTVTIVLQSANFPTNGTVNVYVKPRNAAQSILPATYVSGNSTLANWQVTTTMLPAYSVIQARAVAP